MGRVIGAYGIKGWIKIQPFSARTEGLQPHRRWWIGRDPVWRQVEVQESVVHSASLVARLAGVADREAAAGLRGLEVAIERKDLPAIDADEVYWSDLIGLDVVNAADESLGRIVEVFSNGAHDVLRVGERGPDGKSIERLLPYVGAIVKSVDLRQRRVEVDWDRSW